MKPEDIPVLEDYLTFPDAAKLLGISNQAFHKMVFTRDILKDDIRSIGDKPIYVLPRSAVSQLAKTRLEAALTREANKKSA